MSTNRSAKFSVPLVNAKHGDNGIMFYGREEMFASTNMAIDIVQNGAVATGDVYPQPERTGVLWDAYLIKAKRHTDSTQTLCYVATVIQKVIKPKFSYDKKAYWKDVSKLEIVLPVNSPNDHIPDLAYMESYIRELEGDRIRGLEKWLEVSGLKDYRVTAQEQKALDDWHKGRVRSERRKIVELFDVANTHCVLGEWVSGRKGKVPYVTASACDNSVSSYVDYKNEFIDRGNAIVIGGKTFVVTYQSEDFFSNDSHNLVLRLKDKQHRFRDVYLYLIGAINAGLSAQYSWGDSVSYKKIQKDEIAVPVSASGEVDYDFMSRFICATIKQAIRGVVAWKDREIAATRRAVAAEE